MGPSLRTVQTTVRVASAAAVAVAAVTGLVAARQPVVVEVAVSTIRPLPLRRMASRAVPRVFGLINWTRRPFEAERLMVAGTWGVWL